MMATDVDIAIRPHGDEGVVVAAVGEIDLFTAPEFKRAVARAVSRVGTTLVIDLTQATFMDSSSLGVLIGAHRRLTRHGQALVIACDQEAILKVLRITGLDGLFDVVPAVPDVNALSRR